MIKRFRAWQHGRHTIKDVLPHQSKAGTPTMGGALVLGTFFASSLLLTRWDNIYVWLLLGLVAVFGAIGLADDWFTITKKWRNGVPGRVRLLLQSTAAAGFVLAATHLNTAATATALYLPFFKDVVITLSLVGFVVFGVLVLVGSANAVNLTDGLDGLVSIPSVIVAASFAVLAYIAGRVDYTTYLHITHVAGAGEIAVLCAAMVGAVLGFLWFNAPPARIFLGDTGSLAIGAFLGGVAVVIKQEFVLFIIGGLFVVETLSVIIQVASFKLTGKRVFKMAPLHHHFEQLGWPESTIVVRFWIISLMLALVGLATLKLR